MRRLDRYLLFSLFKVSISGALISLVILLSLQALRLSSLIVKSGLTGMAVVRMLGGLSLSFTPVLFPIAFLFALLIVFGRMSADREMVAMQAMGHSPRRLLSPCLTFGVIVSVVTFLCGFFWAPAGNRMFEETIDEAFRKKVTSVLRAGTFSEGFLNMVLFVDEVDPKTGDLMRVFLHDEKSYDAEISISSKRGEWIAAGKDGWAKLKLKDGVIVSRDLAKKTIRRVRFEEYVINADFSQEAGRSRDSPPSLGWGGLLDKRRFEIDKDGGDPRGIYAEMARRFGVSFVCFLFVPFTFALSLNNQRTAKNKTVMIGILTLILYWTFYFTSITWVLKADFALSKNELFVWLVAWFPNILVAIAAKFVWDRRFNSAQSLRRSRISS